MIGSYNKSDNLFSTVVWIAVTVYADLQQFTVVIQDG